MPCLSQPSSAQHDLSPARLTETARPAPSARMNYLRTSAENLMSELVRGCLARPPYAVDRTLSTARCRPHAVDPRWHRADCLPPAHSGLDHDLPRVPALARQHACRLAHARPRLPSAGRRRLGSAPDAVDGCVSLRLLTPPSRPSHTATLSFPLRVTTRLETHADSSMMCLTSLTYSSQRPQQALGRRRQAPRLRPRDAHLAARRPRSRRRPRGILHGSGRRPARPARPAGRPEHDFALDHGSGVGERHGRARPVARDSL
jgi:hypothetical protein